MFKVGLLLNGRSMARIDSQRLYNLSLYPAQLLHIGQLPKRAYRNTREPMGAHGMGITQARTWAMDVTVFLIVMSYFDSYTFA